ncbi:MAG: restriction endonuclease subunit R, partial [Candidatus Zixiibacteriota bacterium]
SYLLGLLNSKLLWWFIQQTAAAKQGGFFEFKPMYVSQTPISTTSAHQPVEALVDQILAITKDDDYVSDPAKQAKVKELERQIDRMVYELYGLTPEESAVVEGKK